MVAFTAKYATNIWNLELIDPILLFFHKGHDILSNANKKAYCIKTFEIIARKVISQL